MKPIKKVKNGWDLALLVLAAVLFTLTLVYMFTIWNLRFHSDVASANMLAREQMRTGQLFPDTWNMATGLLIFFYNVLIIPLSLFTNNQILLSNMAIAIVLIAFVLLLMYFSKKILKSNFYLIILILFFSGISSTVVDIAFVQAGYLINLLFYAIYLILFIRSFTENWEIDDKRYFVGILAFTAFLSIHGPLYFAYFLVPLWGGGALLFILQYAKAPWNDVRQALARAGKIVIPIIAAIVVGSAGYYAIARHVNFSSGTNITNPPLSDAVNKFVEFIFYALGYSADAELFSLQGLTNVMVVFGFAGAVVCCILLFRKYYEQPFAMKMLMNMSLFIFAIYGYFDFTIYCQGEAYRYVFIPWMFLIFLASYYIYTYIFSQGVVMKAISILCVAAFSLPNMLVAVPQVAHYSEAREAQLGLVEFLKDNDLKHGYATFWNAGKNMVLSDFEVEIGGVSLGESISPYLWLSSTTTYDPDAYSGKSFLLLTQEENEAFSNSFAFQKLGTPEETLSHENYIIYVYPYNIAENDFNRIAFPALDHISRMSVSDESMRVDDSTICVSEGQLIYGPYITLDPGRYQVDVRFSEIEGDVLCKLTSGSGSNTLKEEILNAKEQTVFLDAAETLTNFEVVLSTDSFAVLSSIIISKIG